MAVMWWTALLSLQHTFYVGYLSKRIDFKRPYKNICPPTILNLCGFNRNPSKINTILTLIPVTFGSSHLSSRTENTMKLFSSGFDEWTSYRSLFYAATITLAVGCKAKTLIPLTVRTWAWLKKVLVLCIEIWIPGVFAELVLIHLWCKRVSDIHEIHTKLKYISTFSLTQKITKISKCCCTSPTQMHRETRKSIKVWETNCVHSKLKNIIDNSL